MYQGYLTKEKLFAYLIIDDIQVEEGLLNKAKNNDGHSLSEIGKMYYNKNDYTKAIDWLHLSAAQDYPYAQCLLGYMYHMGKGVSVDYNLSMEWFIKAHQNGFVVATYDIGFRYNGGYGVPKDYEIAMIWFQEAAIKRYKGAQYHVGRYYEFGRGVEVDKQYAIEWYKRSIEQGFEKARNAIERLNNEGIYIADQQKSYIQIEKDNTKMRKKIKSLEDAKKKKKLKRRVR